MGALDLQISGGNLVDLEMWGLLRRRRDNHHCFFTPHVTINIVGAHIVIIVTTITVRTIRTVTVIAMIFDNCMMSYLQ